MTRSARKSCGFTLVEILIAFFLTAVVSTAIYKVYISQNKSHAVQERVAGSGEDI